MKKIIPLLIALCYFSLSKAQNINFEQSSVTGQFQDADVGAMDFADIDNDADYDLIITGKGGPIKSTLYENDGDGNFTEITGTPFDNAFGGTVGFEDIDNDGDQDLLMTGSNSSSIRIAKLYKNDGDGNYSLVTNTPFEGSAGGDFAFGDVDNDGDQDVLITGFNTMDLGFSTLYLNNGSGSFTAVTGTLFKALRSSTIEFLDIDNDDDLDVIIAGEDNNDNPSTNLYRNNGGANFSLLANTPFDNVATGAITTADSDNDGDQDILISGKNDNGEIISKLYLNDGTGSFSLLTGTPFAGTFVGASSFADFDNDGDYDVLIVGSGPGGLADNSIVANIYENQGANNFTLADSLIGAYLSSAAIADVNGDAFLDLIIGGTSTGFPVRETRLYTNLFPITLSTEKEKEEQSLRVFPNPTNGVLNIQLEQLIPTSIQIFKVTGELVYSKHNLADWNNQIQLDLASGFYMLVINTKEYSLSRKLIMKN